MYIHLPAQHMLDSGTRATFATACGEILLQLVINVKRWATAVRDGWHYEGSPPVPTAAELEENRAVAPEDVSIWRATIGCHSLADGTWSKSGRRFLSQRRPRE